MNTTLNKIREHKPCADLRKAAEMALNALEFHDPLIEDYGSKEQLTSHKEAIMALYKALAQPEQESVELKYLRDVHTAQGSVGTWNSGQYMCGLFNGLEFALSIFENREPVFKELAQPEQEPVWCGCGDGIVVNDEAKCGICVMQLENQIERMKAQSEQEYERGRLDGIKQERALNEMSKISQELGAYGEQDVYTKQQNIDKSEECVHKTEKNVHEWQGLTDADLRQIILAAVGVAEAKLREKNNG